MTQNGYSDTIVNAMLSWLKGAANWVLRLFDLSGSGGISPLEWLSRNWLKTLIVLVVVGVVLDRVIWFIRWRPYWVWFNKKRLVIDDDEFFAGEELASEGMYDADIFGKEILYSETPEDKRRREMRRRRIERERRRASEPKKRAKKPRSLMSMLVVREPEVRKPTPIRKWEKPEPAPDVFEQDFIHLANARQEMDEDDVFNVSDLPDARRPQRVKPKPAKARDDDLFGGDAFKFDE